MRNEFELTENEWDIIVKSDYVSIVSEEDFAFTLRRYMFDIEHMFGVNQAELSRISGIESTLISKYKDGKRKPPLSAIIILSLAMKLTPDRSHNLLYKAGYQLNNCEEHRIYSLFLNGCAFSSKYNLTNCNNYLLLKGYPKLNNK